LDSIAEELRSQDKAPKMGEMASTSEKTEGVAAQSGESKNRSLVHDRVVEIVVANQHTFTKRFESRSGKALGINHTTAKMIITLWDVEGEEYFTLTFTSTDSSSASLHSSYGQSRQVTRISTSNSLSRPRFDSHSSPSSTSSSRSPSYGPPISSALTGPTAASLSSPPFPPPGPPSISPLSSTPSLLQKTIMMKDALLDNTETPILAMWKDESIIIPNRGELSSLLQGLEHLKCLLATIAARRLFNPQPDAKAIKDGYDLMTKWQVWNEDFTKVLEPSEYPISVLVRTQQPFSSRIVGMHDPDTGKEIVFDVLGEAIRDEKTEEFLAGMVTCRDVTKAKSQLAEQVEKDEQRFQIICDSMPQMIWTATPTGMHDWFSNRWYEYTGLTEEHSLGTGWERQFHPDDMLAANKRWGHSLATGEPYSTEYRCRSSKGELRWMLGRALPMRNKQTGAIEKWFGTCTDIHEAVEAKISAKCTRQQLLNVIAYAQVTLFAVDRHRKLTLLEGAFIWDVEASGKGLGGKSGGKVSRNGDFIGMNIYEVFYRTNENHPRGQIPPSLAPIEDILTGRTMEDTHEHVIGRS
jgi:PAS domain S-box-containing protein